MLWANSQTKNGPVFARVFSGAAQFQFACSWSLPICATVSTEGYMVLPMSVRPGR